ncbi:hypothetical protein [Sporolactobacillus pectinivorans]|uniref:hypothetical protein n=1 Tax=Sporolactobacillus pectinivorans TaxID=1591408 RepID=UPI000C25F717|nr:hypothetical protein [Sporolactobacillus pectinivorans]
MILLRNMLRTVLTGGLSVRRIYQLLTVFTLLIPVVYGAYLVVTMARQNLSFNTLLISHPLYSVMFLVVLLDVIWSYLMFVVSDDFTSPEGRKYIYGLLFLMAVSQLAIGNIVIAIMAGFILVNMNGTLRQALALATFKRHRLYSFFAVGLVFLSALCCYALIRITFFV